ncbi:hypothetical protein GVAV_002294 [Gurleya vavrai]
MKDKVIQGNVGFAERKDTFKVNAKKNTTKMAKTQEDRFEGSKRNRIRSRMKI